MSLIGLRTVPRHRVIAAAHLNTDGLPGLGPGRPSVGFALTRLVAQVASPSDGLAR